MKVLVAVKRVIDYNVKVQVLADGSDVQTQNVKMSMNPFDEIAIEEAVKLKEAKVATEVVVVTIGAAIAQDVLRNGLAHGADQARLIETSQSVAPIQVARILAKICAEETPDLVLLGKQAIDDDASQVGPMLAALMDWPQATFASKLSVVGPQQIEVEREIDAGAETLRLKLPAVVTTDLRLNVPRFLSLPNIMQAKKKPLQTQALDQLEVSLTPVSQVQKVYAAPVRQVAPQKLDSAQELVQVLIAKGI